MDKQSFLSAAKTGVTPGAKTGKPKLKAWRGDVAGDNWWKILAFGVNGSGKTHMEVGMLLCGERIFHCDYDFGGNGIRTVKTMLRKLGRTDLLQNIVGFDFTSYEQFSEFLSDPTIVEIVDAEGKATDIYSWEPTLIFHDGFTNFQKNYIDEYVLSLDPFVGKDQNGVPKEADARRQEGLRAEIADYDAIRRLTFRVAGEMLTMHNKVTGKPWNKIVTGVEGEPRENSITHEKKSGVDLTGSARNFFNGGFDLVLQLSALAPPGKTEPNFKYICHPGKSFTKTRYADFPAEMKADPVKLWYLLNEKEPPQE